MANVQLHLGDCLEIMKTMEPNSVDSIVTDPPAGIAFMNKTWDRDKGGRTQWIAWMTEVAAECLRLIKPGGHALVWALPRTSHWTATAWEDAGFELRDCLYHIHGQGFPKNLDISKQLDRQAGAEREVIGYEPIAYPDSNCWGKPNSNSIGDNFGVSGSGGSKRNTDGHGNRAVTAPATVAAKQWAGWGTSLKPSVECWWLLRKPLSEKNIAANVQAWGCGGLNIDATRIPANGEYLGRPVGQPQNAYEWSKHPNPMLGQVTSEPQGRWPANLLLDPEAAALLDEMSGERRSAGNYNGKPTQGRQSLYIADNQQAGWGYDDSPSGASRFFARFAHDEDDAPLRFAYIPKASKRDRDDGLEGMEERRTGAMDGNSGRSGARVAGDGVTPVEPVYGRNHHCCVKPTQLMRWLVRLVTPPGGTVLDPFCGSGSTLKAAVLEGFNGVGIELDPEYLAIAEKRIQHAQGQAQAHMPQLPLLDMTGD